MMPTDTRLSQATPRRSAGSPWAHTDPICTRSGIHAKRPPASDRNNEEPPEAELPLAPPRRGTRIRVCDFEPESVVGGLDSGAARKQFERIGGGHAFTGVGVPRHPLMHRTESIDYGIVLEGEITLILDNQETVVRAGDVVVQRGTNHAWANRGKGVCRMAFVLIDGVFDDELA
jgi:mannose-6-phosphate isomerase-like protein (cupin superfamily)